MAVRGPSGPSGAHQNLTNVSPKSPGTPLLQKRTRDFCSRLLPGVAQGTGTAHAVPVPPGVRPVSLFCAWPVSPWVSVLGVLIIAVVNNLLNLIGVPPFLREAFKGVIVIVAVLLQKKEKV